jgi:dihydroxy-acid dehydratase
VAKVAVDDRLPRRFQGPARVFGTREEALAGLAAGKIGRGDVVVLRGIGLRGGPGMGLTSALIFALDGAGLGGQVAFITDGQFSGLVNTGIVIGEVSPEAAEGGPLGQVRDGDTITIDTGRRTVDLDVPADELARRGSDPAPLSSETGWLGVYERSVRPLSAGATLGGTTPAPALPASPPNNKRK